ncbi:MAG: DUF805 domain-containing protein [Lactovum sp.]
MLEAYKKFWKGYVNFSDRSTVADYWWVALFNVIISIPIFIIWFIIFLVLINIEGSSSSGALVSLFIILIFIMVLYGLATIIPNWAIAIRRMRDTGYPWPFIFLNFIPTIGPIILIVFMCLPSKETKENENIKYF